MKNHEIWMTCESCYQEYDNRVHWGQCPYCNNQKLPT